MDPMEEFPFLQTPTMDKRTHIKLSGMAGAGSTSRTPRVRPSSAVPRSVRPAGPNQPVTLPELGYDYGAIEPVIDRKTMEIHHGKHHAGYACKLNAALEGRHPLEGSPLNPSCPASDRTTRSTQQREAGISTTPCSGPSSPAGQPSAPEGDLAARIDTSFGSLDALKSALPAAAGSRFGSG